MEVKFTYREAWTTVYIVYFYSALHSKGSPRWYIQWPFPFYHHNNPVTSASPVTFSQLKVTWQVFMAERGFESRTSQPKTATTIPYWLSVCLAEVYGLQLVTAEERDMHSVPKNISEALK